MTKVHDDNDGESLWALPDALKATLKEAALKQSGPQQRRAKRARALIGEASEKRRRIQALRESRKQREEENRQLRAELDRLRMQQPVPQPQADPYRAAEEARREAEQVALMAPHEVAAYYAQKAERTMQAQLARQSVETSDRIDRMMWSQIRSSEASARRLDSQVESYLAQARSQGMNPTREAIYNLLIGQEVRAKQGRQTEAQRRGAARRVASQTTRPGTPRNGAAPQQRPRDDSDEALIAIQSRRPSLVFLDIWLQGSRLDGQ